MLLSRCAQPHSLPALNVGGVKVDAFIYSPQFSSEIQGTTYSQIMHTTDWFPTILDLADITYDPPDGYELDGVSQVDGWYSGSAQRDYLLYNWYYNVENKFLDMWTNGSFAIRNSQYKLMHAYDSSTYGAWYDYSDMLSDDDNLGEHSCCPSCSWSGTYTYYLFDLTNDPYETTNLYDSDDDDDVSTAKSDLYAALESLRSNAALSRSDSSASKAAYGAAV
jgi:arylsulfatase A-like enzyme